MEENKPLILALVFFFAEAGLQVSGITNVSLAVVLWGTAALLFIYWLWHLMKQWRRAAFHPNSGTGRKLIVFGQYLFYISMVGMALAFILIFFGQRLDADYRIKLIQGIDPTVVGEPTPPRILPDGRIVVGVTPLYLMRIYKVNTTAKADKLAEEFIGKWIEVTGPFGDVASPFDNRNPRMLVSFDFADRPGLNSIPMYFDAARWQKYLELLIKDQEISVRGQIKRIGSFTLELGECEFINPQTHEVIEGVAR